MGSLRALAKVQRTIPVEIEDVGTINVTYKRAAYNDLVEDAVQEKLGQSRPNAATIEAILATVTGWDLKWDDDDPDPVPLTHDALRQVPLFALSAILTAIGEDGSPKKETSISSNGR